MNGYYLSALAAFGIAAVTAGLGIEADRLFAERRRGAGWAVLAGLVSLDGLLFAAVAVTAP